MRTRVRDLSLTCALLIAALSAPPRAHAYPLDASERTGIARLGAYLETQDALLARGTLKPGSLWPSSDIALTLADRPDFELPASDAALAQQLKRLLGGEADRYGIALLDLSDPEDVRYVEHRARIQQNPGSVGKLLAALGWLQALADAAPIDLQRRERILRESQVTADAFIRSDDHTVPIYAPGDERVRKRLLQIGDRGNLWTWLDWMLSSSSNAAASMVIQQLMLFRTFGGEYPPPPEAARDYFEKTPRSELTASLVAALNDPIDRAGLDRTQLRQGGFFTAEAKRRVPGADSAATPHELMRFLVLMEQGRLVDAWSSLELKRLIYLTDRRIRYASHPALDSAAVYFKSGSLYSCQPEEGFVCRKYHGNVRNFMNSVAIVETNGERPLRYLVVVLSNVLRKNSAVDHQTLALRIHRLIEARHKISPSKLGPVPDAAPAGP